VPPSPLAPRKDQQTAATEDQFIDLVKKVFRSERVLGKIQALIARSNDFVSAPEAEAKEKSEGRPGQEAPEVPKDAST
jgi:hypothetical protein